MSDIKHYNGIKEIYFELLELGDDSGIKALQEQVYKTYNITLEELCSVKPKKPKGYWDIKQNCMEDALKYTTRKVWGIYSYGAYVSAIRNGWIEDCCKHMIIKHYWNKPHCMEDALNYNTQSEWRKESNSAYQSARRNGWMHECCKHMTPKQHPAGYWTEKRCMEDASNFEYRSDWKKSSTGYKAAQRMGIIDKCCKHMKPKVRNYA